MTILIAGATGLIGKKIIALCIEKGYTIHYLTTKKSKIKNEQNVLGFFWNPDEQLIDKNAFNNVEIIINLAGASVSKRWTKAYKSQILSSRVNTAQVIKNYLSNNHHQVKQYISASGISIYKNSTSHLHKEKSTQISNSFLAEVVKVWEQEADAFSSLGIKITKLRTGIVLDRQEGAFPKILQPIKYGFGAVLGNGEQWQSWIHINDIAAIYLFLAENQLEGVFNGVAPNPVTHKTLTKKIAQKLGKPLWLPPVPVFALKLMLGEMSDLVLESQLVDASKILDSGFIFQYVNLSQALEPLLKK